MPIFNDTNLRNMGDITPNMNCENNYHSTKSIRLDDIKFTSKIDLIKIDVQGWGKNVLLGAKSLLQTHKPTVIIEFEHFQLKRTNITCEDVDQHYLVEFYLIYRLFHCFQWTREV